MNCPFCKNKLTDYNLSAWFDCKNCIYSRNTNLEYVIFDGAKLRGRLENYLLINKTQFYSFGGSSGFENKIIINEDKALFDLSKLSKERLQNKLIKLMNFI